MSDTDSDSSSEYVPCCCCDSSDGESVSTRESVRAWREEQDRLYLTHRNKDTFEQTAENVLLSMEKWGSNIHYVRDEFITYTVCKAAIDDDNSALQYIKRELLTETEYYNICLLAVDYNGWCLRWVPPDVQTQELCDVAVESICWALQYVRDEYKTYENCMSAVQRNGQILVHVPQSFIDMAMCVVAVTSRYECLNLIPREFVTRELCYSAVRANGRNIQYVPDEFMSTELAWIAIKSPEPCASDSGMAGLNVRFVPEAYVTRELILEAVKCYSSSYGYIPDSFKSQELDNEVLDIAPSCIWCMTQTPENCMRALRNNHMVIDNAIKEESITREMAEYVLALPRKLTKHIYKERLAYLRSLVADVQN